jgi:hypothetical protein
MSFLEEIRKQSHGVRQAIFFLSVIITVSIIGTVWFNSFQKDLYVTLNSEEEYEQKFYAQEDSGRKFPPLEWAGNGLVALRAGMYSLLDFNSSDASGGVDKKSIDDREKRVYLFPISQDK